MSTRMYLETKNGTYQLFGNNDCPSNVIQELIKQGLKFNPKEEDSFYHFEVKDIQPIVDEIKNEFFKKLEDGKKVADFTNNFTQRNGTINKDLYLISSYILENSYLFELYNVIQFLKPHIDIKKSSPYFDKFVLKEDAKVKISMY